MIQKNIQGIENINYSQFVSLIKERNRPSGGIKTVHNVAVNAFINSSKKILEIGSNTGFTSVNLSVLTGCKSIGIEVNEKSISEAKKYAKKQGVSKLVSFQKASALKLPFPDNSFDIVWCSNVTSFISDKNKAVKEYLRVLKLKGSLVVIPIYYIKQPPKKIINDVSKAIGTKIEIWNKNFWLELFQKISEKEKNQLELYCEQDFRYLDRKEFILEYVEKMAKRECMLKFNKKDRDILKSKLEYFMELFNENLKYAGYSIFLYQKRIITDEIELFLSQEIKT